MKKHQIFIYLIIFLVIVSCGRKDKPRIKGIDLQIEIQRFEEDIMNLDLSDMASSIEDLKEKYGDFLDLFSIEVINIGSPDALAYPDYLQRFVTDYLINEVYKEVSEKFNDLSVLEEKLTTAFKYHKYYFPEDNTPDILTYISGFNHSMAVTENTIGIGLDKYLGAGNDYYVQLGYEQYRRYNMHPQKIPSDAITAFAMTKYAYNDSSDNLINQMIYHGKIEYYTKKLLPGEPDSLIFGFTPGQLKFCENNEETMWSYLVENKLLFETDLFTIRKFIGDAPFTKDFTNDSPGKAAIWIGYKIVDNYMERNRKTSLKQLMENNNYQEILKQSNYHP